MDDDNQISSLEQELRKAIETSGFRIDSGRPFTYEKRSKKMVTIPLSRTDDDNNNNMFNLARISDAMENLLANYDIALNRTDTKFEANHVGYVESSLVNSTDEDKASAALTKALSPLHLTQSIDPVINDLRQLQWTADRTTNKFSVNLPEQYSTQSDPDDNQALQLMNAISSIGGANLIKQPSGASRLTVTAKDADHANLLSALFHPTKIER